MSRRRSRARLSAVTVGVVVAFALTAGVLLSGRMRPAPRPAAQPPAPAATPRPAQSTPAPRVELRRVRQTPAAQPTAQPAYRVAIVFDDAGGSLADVEGIIAIGRPVAVAVLPGLEHSTEVTRRVQAAGLEVLLHLPVEPHDDTKAMGPGGVMVAMSDADIQSTVRAGLASVPGAVGVNNHMGSKGTADRRVVRAMLEVVRQERLFFLDSYTTLQSVVGTVATELGVRTATRAVFLDNEDEEEAIRRQIRRLITLAKERGEAIAIGHAHRITPLVVAGMLDELDREGIAIVPVSTLVR